MIPYTPYRTFMLWFMEIYPWFIFHQLVAWGFGIFYAMREFLRRKDVKVDVFLQMLLIGFLGAMAGARFFAYFGPWAHDFGDISMLERFLAMLSPKHGGWVAYGGIVGGLGAGYAYAAFRKIGVKRYFNVFMPAVPLGVSLARIGCFISGDSYGTATSLRLPWILDTGTSAIHPTQLYNSLTNFAIFIVLLRLYDRNLREGVERNLFFYYLLMYSVFRFLTESLRGDYIQSEYFYGLTASQIISIIGFVISAAYLIFIHFSGKHEKKPAAGIEPLNIRPGTYATMIAGMLVAVVSILFIGTQYKLIVVSSMTAGLLVLLYGINSIFPPLKRPLKKMFSIG